MRRGMRRRSAAIAAALVAVVCAAVPGVGATPAAASVRIGASQIVVANGSGADAVIERAPFRLVFRDASGRVVLAEVADPCRPLQGTAQVDPEPLGTHNLPKPDIYAPLAYEVGGSVGLQWPGASYQGDMLTSGNAGAVYCAQKVVSASPSGENVKLTVSTDDPTGRVLYVDVAPDGPRGFRVRSTPSSPAGISAVSDAFASAPGEAFHGFGGRHIGVDQRGKAFYGWIEQENFGPGQAQPIASALPGTDPQHYMFPDGENAAYTVHESFVSSRGYSFLLNQPGLARWRLDSDDPGAWSVAASDEPGIDYSVFMAPPQRAAGVLTSVTGRSPAPPAFAELATISQPVSIGGSYGGGASSYLAAVQGDLTKIEKDRLAIGEGGPTGNFAFEGWAGLGDAEDRTLIARIHADGMHAIGYVRAFVGNDGGAFDSASDYQAAVQNGYCATTAAGTPYLYQEASNQSCVIDFTNPAAVAWWRDRLFHMFNLGFDGFMQDFGEQVVAGMHFHDGESGLTMHNRYPIVYDQVTAKAMSDYERAHPGRHLWDYTRAGFSGRPGNAAYSYGDFPGDENTDFSDQNGLPTIVPDMLNRGVGGAYGFNTDVGGYADFVAPTTTPELFDRWAEAAALMPYFRVHMDGDDPQMPWTIGSGAEKVYVAMARLHAAALPLIRSRWAQADRTGVPVEVPLWMASPSDPAAALQQEEFMLGPHVLVAPVVTQGAQSRPVYFPRGCWRSPYGGETYRGPATPTIATSEDNLPFFFTCGTRPFKVPAP